MFDVSAAPDRRPSWRRALARNTVLLPLLAALLVLAASALGEALGLLLGLLPWRGALVAACAVALLLPLAIALTWRLVRHEPSPLPRSDDGASRDPLTGTMTQRYFVAAADREWARVRRYDEDAALLMIDVDHLRALNELQGPDCGDAVLVEMARLAAATLRPYDLLSRFGGGVLVAYLPHTDPIGVLDAAERIRERVAAWRLGWHGRSVAVTVSIGAASVGPDHSGLDAVIADAGSALREAKEAGRNCVRAAPVQARRAAASGTPLGGHRAAGKA